MAIAHIMQLVPQSSCFVRVCRTFNVCIIIHGRVVYGRRIADHCGSVRCSVGFCGRNGHLAFRYVIKNPV